MILKLLSYGYYFQPRKLQLFWGARLGSFLRLIRFRSSVIRQNLALAYPNDGAIQNRIHRESYEYLGHLVLEILMLFGPMRKFVLKYVDLTGQEHMDAALKQGKGFIFLSSHVGNWEVMAATGGLLAGLDLMLVTKKLKPEWVHQGITLGRKKCRVTATFEPKTLRDILSHLKKNGAVGFVLDQYAGPPVGVRVPLFGVPVGTPLALAALAKRTQVPILPVENYRKPDGRWAVVVGPPIQWKSHSDTHYELALNTAEYASILEKNIRDHPGQWLWTHRRFKGDLSPLRETEWNEPRVRR